jgi:uncharacterized membrane protein
MTADRELQRVETFSDGVFAIACTLLILEIKVPHMGEDARRGALWAELRHLWPSFVAYALGFCTIFVAWAGHHRALAMLKECSKPFLYANGLLLLTITFIPFPTALLAEHINTAQAHVAVMFYAVANLGTSAAFYLWWYTMQRPRWLFSDALSPAMHRRATRQMWVGSAVVVVTAIVAKWFPMVALVMMAVSQVIWIIMSLESTDM